MHLTELIDIKLDPQHLVLPPALRPVGPNRDLKVIVHYGAQFVTIGCGPTYSDVQIFLKHRYNDHIFKVCYIFYCL